MWCAYVLQSEKNDTFYTGSTDNIERRVWEHNNNFKINSFTYKNRPYRLVYLENYSRKEEARKRERYLKTGKGREDLVKLINQQTIGV